MGKACKILTNISIFEYNIGGIGIYAGFPHIDVRKVKARWKGK